MAALVAMTSLVVCADPAGAQEPPFDLSLPLHAQLEPLPTGEADLEERLAFLEQRLEDVQLEGRLWYYGWLGVHGAGAVYNAVDASLADNDDDRVVGIVDATKSAIGVGTLLVRPLPARLGADPIRAMPGGTPELALAQVRAAENLLERSAQRARRKYTIWPHLESMLVNVAGGGIIWGLGNWEDAAMSTGLGLLVGELRIWTLPSQPAADLIAYQRRFDMLSGPRQAGWYLVPRPNGIALALRF